MVIADGSHALRGNDVVDAPRPVFDAERLRLHAHAERGRDQTPRNPVGAYEQREAAIGCAAVVKMLDSLLTLRVLFSMHSVGGCMPTRSMGTIKRRETL
jgi:hypothetical protein